jgi:hypothetical protein
MPSGKPVASAAPYAFASLRKNEASPVISVAPARLPLVAEADSKLQGFLPQGSFRSLHLLCDLGDRRPGLRVLLQQLHISGGVFLASQFALLCLGHFTLLYLLGHAMQGFLSEINTAVCI